MDCTNSGQTVLLTLLQCCFSIQKVEKDPSEDASAMTAYPNWDFHCFAWKWERFIPSPHRMDHQDPSRLFAPSARNCDSVGNQLGWMQTLLFPAFFLSLAVSAHPRALTCDIPQCDLALLLGLDPT